MKLYKLKHIPTGLFYTPSRGSGNLSKNGKIYTSKPRLEWTETIRIKIYSRTITPKGVNKILSDYFMCDWNDGFIDKCFKTKSEDWEIIEIN